MARKPTSRQRFAVEGADELQAVLSRLADADRPRIMRAGLDEGSAFVLHEMRTRVRKRHGDLERNLTRHLNVRKGETTSAAIGPRKVKGQWWAARGRWLEFGTKSSGTFGPRLRRSGLAPGEGTAKALTTPEGLRATSRHVGHGAHPFMRPALDNNANRIYRIMASAMWDAIRASVK